MVLDDNVEFARLLGTLLLEQGLKPVIVHSAEQAFRALAARRYAALVVDMLLPDLTGRRLLERLKEHNISAPTFVMSGVFKGQNQREKAQAILPVAGWYEKPFDTRLLVERIAHAVGHEAVGRHAHQPIKRVTRDFDIDILEPVEAPAESMDFDVDVSFADAPEPSGPPRRDPARPGGFAAGRTASAAELAAGLRTSLRVGDLAHTTLPRLVHAFFVAQETGEIAFERGSTRKIVYFDHGWPTHAISNQDEERLGRLAQERVPLDASQVEDILRRARESSERTGDIMVQLGLISERQRDQLLEEQTRRILRSLFAWDAGRYVIGFRGRVELRRAPLSESLGSFILRGVRELFAVDRLRRHLPDGLKPSPSPNPTFALSELPLSDLEARLLLDVTGRRSVAQLVERAAPRLSEQGVRAVLYALLATGVLVPATGDRSAGSAA